MRKTRRKRKDFAYSPCLLADNTCRGVACLRRHLVANCFRHELHRGASSHAAHLHVLQLILSNFPATTTTTVTVTIVTATTTALLAYTTTTRTFSSSRRWGRFTSLAWRCSVCIGECSRLFARGHVSRCSVAVRHVTR